MTSGPVRRLADLRTGLRLVEAATGTVWEIERVHRANTYSTPWVHLVGPGGARRVEGAGSLIAEPGDPVSWSAEGVEAGA